MKTFKKTHSGTFREAYRLYRCGRKIYSLCLRMSRYFEPFSEHVEIFMSDAEDFKSSQTANIKDVFGSKVAHAVEYAFAHSKIVPVVQKRYRQALLAKNSLDIRGNGR